MRRGGVSRCIFQMVADLSHRVLGQFAQKSSQFHNLVGQIILYRFRFPQGLVKKVLVAEALQSCLGVVDLGLRMLLVLG